jgi:hypothetical protein
MADHIVVGKVGRVTDRIWPGRLGAVIIPVRGGTEEFYARAAPGVAIPAGETVKVTAYAPPRSVDVELVESEPGTPPFRIPPRG